MSSVSVLGLKPGQVIWVTFCPGQVGLTHFIRYLGLTQIILYITCVDNNLALVTMKVHFPILLKMFQIWSLMVTIF